MILGLLNAQDPKADLRQVSRIVHSIKGTAGSVDLHFASTVCHVYEDHLLLAVTKELKDEVTERLMAFNDLLREAVSTDPADGSALNQLRQKLQLLSINETARDEGKEMIEHRVLISEPTSTFLSILRHNLSDFGLQFSVATDGAAAFDRLVKEEFDSVIFSNNTLFVTGPQLIQMMHVLGGRYATIPKILTTSDSPEEAQKLVPAEVATFQKTASTGKEIAALYRALLEDNRKGAADRPEGLKRIYCIDDDKVLLRMVEKGLKTADQALDIETFENGQALLTRLEEDPCDLCLVDLQIGEESGVDVVKKIKTICAAHKKKLPTFVFLTATADANEIAKINKEGVAGIISKPVKVNEIAPRVFQLFDT